MGKIYRIFIIASLFLIFGCNTAKLIEYSSVAGNEQNVSVARTEMYIIKGDDENIQRDFFVVSAVDYLLDGKKSYYLIIVPSSNGSVFPKIDDLKLNYDYSYIIQSHNINDLIMNIEKSVNEWDAVEMKYSGVVYNYSAVSPLSVITSYYDDRLFEISPYLKFNYSKTEYGPMAKLTLGTRMDEITYSVVDGKSVKSKVYFDSTEQFWMFDSVEKIRDFHNILSKGYRDLKEKGLDLNSRKAEVKDEAAEVKPSAVTVKTKKKKKTSRRRK